MNARAGKEVRVWETVNIGQRKLVGDLHGRDRMGYGRVTGIQAWAPPIEHQRDLNVTAHGAPT